MKPSRLRLLALGVCAALALGAAWAFRAQPSEKLTWEAVFARITRDWPGVPQMTTAELARRLGEKGGRPVLIDTRTREEYAVSHLPGAVWAETPAPIRAALRDVPPERAVVLYCSVGVRSTFDRAAWRFAGLTLELFLLLPNPPEPRDRVSAGDIQAGRGGGG